MPQDDDECIQTALDLRAICPVSMVSLIANPERFHGRMVRVRGYLSAGIPSFLFLSKDAHDASDLASSVLVSNSTLRSADARGLIESWVEVIGEFDSKRFRGSGVAHGLASAGMIGAAIRVERVVPWGHVRVFEQPDEDLLKMLEALEKPKDR